jgi:hypothetical protein
MKTKIRLVSLPQKKIDAIFEEHKDDAVEAFKAIYAAVIPNIWDDSVINTHRWPTVNHETGAYLMKKFMETSAKGLWWNNGFSSQCNGEQNSLPSWWVDPTTMTLFYSNETEEETPEAKAA